jgi:two-component system, NtrC family, sensor histidine kinase HydH
MPLLTDLEPDDEPVGSPTLSDDVRGCLFELHGRLAPNIPQIADRLVVMLYEHDSEQSPLGVEHQRLRELLIEWMRSGLVGPYDASFRTIRARVGRRFLDRALLQGAVFVLLLVLRGEYQRWIATLYARDEAWRVQGAVDQLLDLELGFMLAYSQEYRTRRLLDRERDAVADRLVALRTLTTGLAHEVRNPLNSARLQLEVLERRLRRELDDARFCGPSELARSEIEKLADLLDELLAFANPSSLDLRRRDVMAIVRDVIEHHPAGAAVELVGPASAIAELDATKMRSILHHLVRNAVEAAPAGSVRVIVRVDPERVLVEVIDDGPGIPTDIRSRVCDPFFSTKEDGTGLGMSIVHSLVALHGGSVDIQSEPGSTTVAVTIPRRAR